MRRYVLKIDWRYYELPEDTTGIDAGTVLDLLRRAKEVDDSYDSSSDVAKMVRKEAGSQLDLAVLLAEVEPKEPEANNEESEEVKGDLLEDDPAF